MERQMDWVQQEANRHKMLLELRAIIERELARNLPFSGPVIRTTLKMIRTNHGIAAEQETIQLYPLINGEQAA